MKCSEMGKQQLLLSFFKENHNVIKKILLLFKLPNKDKYEISSDKIEVFKLSEIRLFLDDPQ